MAGRQLPGLGLKGDWALGEDNWKDENDLNLLALSVLTQGRVLSIVSATPGAPAEGAVHIFDETHPTHANAIAVYDEGGWKYFAATAGMVMWNLADSKRYEFKAGEWSELTAGGGAGLPAGGTTGQVLAKVSNADGDADWADGGGGGSNVIVRSGASAWTVPVVADFTQYNMGTMTVADSPDGIVFNCPAGNGFASRGIYRAVPGAAPWTVYAHWDMSLQAGENNSRVGITLYNAGSGRLIDFGFQNDGGANRGVFVNIWNNSGSYAGNGGGTVYNYMANRVWAKLTNDGANLIFSISNDGLNWRQVYTTTVAGWIVNPTHVGFMFQSSNNSMAVLNSFSFVAPTASSPYAVATAAAGGPTSLELTPIPAFENGWVNYGGIYAPLRVVKTGRMVNITGTIKSGATGAAVITLPAGWRPDTSLSVTGPNAGGVSTVEILPSGAISINALSGNASTYTHVDLTFIVPAEDAYNGNVALPAGVLAYAYSHVQVEGANSPDPEDIPGMSVVFSLPVDSLVELDFDVVLGRLSGAIRLILLIDGADAPRAVPGEVVYNSIGMSEHNNQILKGKQVFPLTAGNHTIKLRASAVSTVTPASYKDRSMIVRRLA